MKKFFSVIMSIVLVLSLSITAFGAIEVDESKIIVNIGTMSDGRQVIGFFQDGAACAMKSYRFSDDYIYLVVDSANMAYLYDPDNDYLESLVSAFDNNKLSDENLAELEKISTDHTKYLEECEDDYYFPFTFLKDETKGVGDIDRDGVTNILDCLLIQKHIAQLDLLPDNMIGYADLNNDGSINILDVTEIQKIIAKIR